jgi:DNA-binding CsgD family transcriptional regulator
MRQQTEELVYLNQQERTCAKWLCSYLTNREVAEKMGLSTRSVETLVEHLKKKFHCYSKVQLVAQLVKQQPEWLPLEA